MPRNDSDRVLVGTHRAWRLDGKRELAQQLQTRIGNIDVVLQDLERAEKVKLTEMKCRLVVGMRRD